MTTFWFDSPTTLQTYTEFHLRWYRTKTPANFIQMSNKTTAGPAGNKQRGNKIIFDAQCWWKIELWIWQMKWLITIDILNISTLSTFHSISSSEDWFIITNAISSSSSSSFFSSDEAGGIEYFHDMNYSNRVIHIVKLLMLSFIIIHHCFAWHVLTKIFNTTLK